MPKTLVFVYHDLSIMLEAGMPIRKSLNTIASGAGASFRNVFTSIDAAIAGGSSLTEAMSRHPNVFAPLDLMVVEAADTAGSLPKSFRLLSEWYEFSNRLKNVIFSGTVLPIVLLHIAAVIVCQYPPGR